MCEAALALSEGKTRFWQWGAWIHEETPDRAAIKDVYEWFIDPV